MKNITLLKLLKFIFLIIFVGLCIITFKTNLSDSSLEFLSKLNLINDNSFTNLIDYSSNSYYKWKFNTYIFGISKYLSSSFSLNFNTVIYYVCLIFFFIFNTYLTKCINLTISTLAASIISLNFLILLILLFGNKTYVISSITFLPFFLFSLINVNKENKNTLLSTLVYLLSLVFLIKSSNHFSFLFIIFSFVIISFLKPEKVKFSKLHIILLIIAITSSLFYITFKIPYVDSFDYPWYARVVQDDGLPGVIRSLLNESALISYVDEISEKHLYLPVVSFISIYILFIIMHSFSSENLKNKYLSYFLLFFIISFLCEFYLSPSLSLILFFKTIWRTIPSILSFSFYPIFLFLMLFSFYIFITQNIKNFIFLFILNVVLGIDVISSNYKPVLIKDDAIKFMKITIKNNYLNSQHKNIILSPSASVIKLCGYNYLINKDNYLNKNIYRNIKVLSPTLTSNYGENSLNQILNKNNNKRYTTLLGKQIGKEWIKISTKEKNNILGIMLDVGNFKTDFPTSILVKTCDDDKENSIKEINNLGNIEFTPSNLPYFGGQNIITILFDEMINTSCIKILQTGINDNFEWSISQIKFILPEKARKNKA